MKDGLVTAGILLVSFVVTIGLLNIGHRPAKHQDRAPIAAQPAPPPGTRSIEIIDEISKRLTEVEHPASRTEKVNAVANKPAKPIARPPLPRRRPAVAPRHREAKPALITCPWQNVWFGLCLS